MIRNLKVLGLALLASLALAGLLAGSAWATPFKFVPEVAGATVKGSADGKFTWGFDAFSAECQKETEEGAAGESEEILTPSGECLVFGLNMKVDFNGCAYDYTTVTLEKDGSYEGALDINCPVGQVTEITVPGCTVTVPAQKGLKKVTYTNKGAGKNQEVTVDLNISGLTYTEHEQKPNPICTNGIKANGTIVGSRTLTAEKGGAMVGFKVA